VAAVNGAPASAHAVQALTEMAIDLRRHRARPLTRELVDSAFLIVVMTASHRDQVCASFPDAADRVHLLKSFGSLSDDVLDPIGMSFEIYKHVRDEIAVALWELDRYIASLDSSEEER